MRTRMGTTPLKVAAVEAFVLVAGVGAVNYQRILNPNNHLHRTNLTVRASIHKRRHRRRASWTAGSIAGSTTRGRRSKPSPRRSGMRRATRPVKTYSLWVASRTLRSPTCMDSTTFTSSLRTVEGRRCGGDKLKGTACPGYGNIPVVTLVIRWRWVLTRFFSYSKRPPSSAVPTDSVRTVCRSDPYSRNRRRQVRSCRWQALQLFGQIRLYRPRSAT
jgi:hypothetical protein